MISCLIFLYKPIIFFTIYSLSQKQLMVTKVIFFFFGTRFFAMEFVGLLRLTSKLAEYEMILDIK